jgi:hypothetical protein
MKGPALLIAAALALACGGCFAREARPAEAHAMRNGYVYLGERFVNGGVDHDMIHVGRRDGQFTSIMLVVENAPVELYDLLVTFGNGQVYEPHTRLVFGPDSTSRMIELPGGARFIRRVDFRYGNLPGGGQAKVELWAR